MDMSICSDDIHDPIDTHSSHFMYVVKFLLPFDNQTPIDEI